MRIGFGYDVHRLVEGRALFLGGVQIPYEKGLEGHSDADVLIHALCDALLGAAALRDIGYHFPDSNDAYKNIDSKILLSKVVALIASKGYTIGNVDCTIVAQAPKLAPYIEQMRVTLAEVMGVPVDVVSAKATTTEKLGFEGRKEGISAYAVALIQ